MNALPTHIDNMPSRPRTRQRSGTTAVAMALMLPVVLAVASYTINVAYMELARTELQITIDVSTRAAGRVLAVTGNQQLAMEAAETFMKENPFANEKMTLSATDIAFGVSTRMNENERYLFASGRNPNSVKLLANGNISVPMLFPTFSAPITFRPIKTSTCTTVELDISIVLDRSGSMAFSSSEISGSGTPAAAPLGWSFGDPVPPNSRWLDAVEAVNRFLELMESSGQDEHVSLATYSDKARTDVELGDNYLRIRQALNGYSAKFDQGSTNIGGGILEGTASSCDKKRARPWASRVMIVLTDGIHNTGTDPLVAARQAAIENVQIFTVTFSSEAETERMKEIAAIGSAKHFHASTGNQLASAFEEIAHSLPTLLTH